MTPARFEAMVAELWDPLQRYLRRRTDAASADDVLGDVLLVLWRRRGDVPAGAELPWAYGVARGCLANHRRADDRRGRLHDRLRSEPVAAEPADDLGLADALARMPEKERELLRLWAWEGLAPREIAVVLDISANAVSIRLHRATTRLRKELTGSGHKPGRQHQPVRHDEEARG